MNLFKMFEEYKIDKNRYLWDCKYFKKSNLKSQTSKSSPSGRYDIDINVFTTKKGCWEYSEARIYKAGHGKPLCVIRRDYDSFPFLFVEDHPNGHDYLICGEHYQRQTIVELDTGKIVSNLDQKTADNFCWVNITASPDKKTLAVDGCYWACPFEVKLVDFSSPMTLPFKEIGLYSGYSSGVKNFNEDGSITLFKFVDYRKSDGKLFDSLTDNEQDLALDSNDIEEREEPILWRPSEEKDKESQIT